MRAGRQPRLPARHVYCRHLDRETRFRCSVALPGAHTSCTDHFCRGDNGGRTDAECNARRAGRCARGKHVRRRPNRKLEPGIIALPFRQRVNAVWRTRLRPGHKRGCARDRRCGQSGNACGELGAHATSVDYPCRGLRRKGQAELAESNLSSSIGRRWKLVRAWRRCDHQSRHDGATSYHGRYQRRRPVRDRHNRPALVGVSPCECHRHQIGCYAGRNVATNDRRPTAIGRVVGLRNATASASLKVKASFSRSLAESLCKKASSVPCL